MVHDYAPNNAKYSPYLRFGFCVLLVLAFVTISAQDDAALGHASEVEYTYAFTIEGVDDPVTAKPVIHAFIDADFSESVQFIDEADEFKLHAVRAIDYMTLEQFLLQHGGWEIGAKVRTSRGEILKATDSRPTEVGGG